MPVYPPLPYGRISFTGNCLNDSVLFANASTGTITSYFWDFGDGTTDTAANPSHLYAQAGTYQVTLIVFLGNGCSDTTSQSLIIYPAPVANFSALNNCGADSVIFSDLSLGQIAAYKWYFGDGDSSTLASPIHHYTGPGVYQVTLMVLDSNGCSDQVTQAVAVSRGPMAAFTTRGGCGLDSVAFINQSTGSIVSYFWDFGDSTTSTLENPKHLYAVADTYQVSLIVVDSSGCADTTVQAVIPSGGPVADFSASNVCEGDTVHFTNQTLGSAIASYLWHFGDTTFSNDENPKHLYAGPGMYQVTLVVLDSSACADSVNKTIEVYSRPRAVFSAPARCDGDSVRFVNLSSPGSAPIANYYWDFADGTLDSTSFAPVHLYPGPGGYWVELTVMDSLGCSDWSTARVSVFAHPTCGIAPPDSLPRCGSTGYTIEADSLTQLTAVSYQWLLQSPSNDWDTVSGSTSAVLTYDAGSDSALFILTVTDSNGCQSTCSLQVVCSSNRPPMSPGSGSYLAHRGFPNPFSQQAQIEIESTVDTRVEVELLDMMGSKIQMLFTGEAEAGKPFLVKLDGGRLTEGVYLYRIRTDKMDYFGKLVFNK